MEIEQITPALTWRLRRDVLYPDKKVFEMEMEDDNYGIHFGAFEDDKLAGVISLFNEDTDFQFRKLAVEPEFQGKGIGGKLLQQVINHAVENGGTRIWCNARWSAIGFYLKAGFRQTGQLFANAAGIDYEIMEKPVTPISNR
jgi:ribosomal protein S18 acetylase RimI-like enzyme